MTMLSKTAVFAAGVCGTIFIGYCFYFDRKRRSDPQFKRNLREKRTRAVMMKEKASKTNELPELKDYESVQKFFIQEVQIGEELLAQGDVENGVNHLSSALSVCGEPSHLLDVLEQQLPPSVYALLLERMPIVSQRMATSLAARRMHEDDVE